MIGKTLKTYVIEEILGKGGMGVVYRARDTRLDRLVALKVLPPDLTKDPDRRRRFVQEAKAASAVNHPAIAQIYEIEEEGDLAFIVMEYVNGSTVRQLVARKELDIMSAVEVGIQVGDALARAHEAGIVHRDIKSDNIMLTRDGHPKILDFGLAKLLDQSGAGDSDARNASLIETVARTQAGMIVGTLAYMSPEQARGMPADRRSDVFSFGIVLYEMATGRLPFEGASAIDTMHAIAYETPQPLTTVRTDLPYSLQRVVARCLQKKPEERYPDMREVVQDLRDVKKDLDRGVSSRMPVLDRMRFWASGLTTKGAVWAVVLGAALGVVAVFMFLLPGEARFGPVFTLGLVGLILYRVFRNRGVKAVRTFVKRAGGMKEVRFIGFHKGVFTVVAENPTARTYLKLNALLDAANRRLLQGEPMTMVVREDVDETELKRLLSSPGAHYLRDDTKRSGVLRKRVEP